MLRKITLVIVVLFTLLVLCIALSVLPTDRYDYKTQSFYRVMMDRLDHARPRLLPRLTKNFSVGYAKINLTPSHPLALAGNGTVHESHYKSVHDSIFVRAIVITNGTERVALVTADLLMIPPTVTFMLEKELPSIGFSLNNTYFGATHSHNSIGNWNKGIVQFIYGKYDDAVVSFIAYKIKECILLASRNCISSTLKTAHIPLREPLRNRIDPNGAVDSLLHVIEINRSDSSKLLVMSYSAHATCLNSNNPQLSRDYPGKLIDEVENRGYDFAMFLAGAVGSQACHAPEGEWNCIDWMATAITTKFESEKTMLQPIRDSTLEILRVPLELGRGQLKILKDWEARPGLFKLALGESPNYLIALRIGELVMLGTPCDYSGALTPQLYSYAKRKNIQVMVTSFNGGYIGYTTPIRYYDVDHYETRLLNW